ncbi:redoxin family protein, partial [bacterium]|nr:redoxin family protein [bacterium]
MSRPSAGVYLLTILASVSLTQAAVKVGEPADESVRLVDLRGNSKTLADYRSAKIRVVAFLSTECPVANVYVPILVDLEKSLRSSGVQFLAVYPQAKDSVDLIAAHAYDRQIPFPVLKDHQGKLAAGLGVERVPTVGVLDDKGILVYRGRIDDQIGVGTRRPTATKQELRTAIQSLLDGNPIDVAESSVDGCLIQRDLRSSVSGEITFAKDVAIILQNKCEECHRPGRIGPFSLSNYNDAVQWADQIKEAVNNRQMPPWHADDRFGHFLNDRRLTSSERDTLLAWIDTGKQKGNDADLPPAKTWIEGWEMGKPDVVFKIPRPQTVPASGVVPYRYLVVPTGFTEDKW